MSESMLERVGNAIRDKCMAAAESSEVTPWTEMARAAIEAMREQTPKMDAAGFDASPGSMLIETGVDHLDIYRAMIDAALSETRKP